MTQQPPAPPPLRIARLGGAMYLMIILLGLFSEVFVRQRLVVGDVMAAAANIRAHELLWRCGVAAELLSLMCVIVLALTWRAVLGPVNRELTWLAIFFVLTAHAVGAIASLQFLSALFPLSSAPWLASFTAEQIAALVRLAMRERTYTFGVTLLLSGCFFVIAGPMIYRSGYFPKVVGLLYTLAGAGYIVHTFTLVLAPAMADRVLMVAGPAILIGETTLSLYLLIKGVRVEGWNRRQAQLVAEGA
jgi:Domain of unknown function (DUF4386)